MFGCTPDVARRQDMRDIAEISDYRNARAAAELWREGAKGVPKLMERPRMAEVLVEMRRAMALMDEGHAGEYTVEHLYEAMRAMPDPDDEDE